MQTTDVERKAHRKENERDRQIHIQSAREPEPD